MKKMIAMLVLIVILCSLASCVGTRSPEQTESSADSEPVVEILPNTVVSGDAVVFDFNSFAVGSDRSFYRCAYSDGLFRYAADGSKESVASGNVTEVSANDDAVYFVKEDYDTNGVELHRIAADGSGDKALFSGTGSIISFVLLNENKLYYDDLGLCEYDIETKTSRVLDEGYYYDFYYLDDGRICYVSVDEELKSYDLRTGECATISGDLDIMGNFFMDNSILYYVGSTTDTNNVDVRWVSKNNKLETLGTITTEDELQIIDIRNSTVFYQNYNSDTYLFTTYTMSLADDGVKAYDSPDYKLYRVNAETDSCFSANGHYLVYDDDSQTFKTIANLHGSDGEIRYLRGNDCCYETYMGEDVRWIKAEFSNELPKKEDFDSGVSSSPDNDYVRLKETIYSAAGDIYKIPELTIQSDDARVINDAMAENYIDYYRCELNGDFLTLYTVTFGENSTRTINLYTLDVTSGKQLDNDDIVALITDDSDAFYEALKQEIKEQQVAVYLDSATDYEIETEDRKRYQIDYEITDDMLTAALDTFYQPVLGYLGDGKVLCATGFRHLAGAEGSKHMISFDYNES
ncbi:MAG: hypothetical protein IJH07_08875 [Ruminococcus sp.]|nr:hypothetical protein [Ruminococcus sp.]